MVSFLDSDKYKPSTLKNMDASISAFYKWFCDENRDFINPYAMGAIIRKRIHSSISKFLVPDEIILLLNGFKNESEKCLVHFMCDTGLRISEVSRLKLKDVPLDLSEGSKYIRLTVPGSKGHGGNTKERQTFISRPVLSRLKRYHNSYEYRFANREWSSNDPEKPMFLSCNGRPVYRELLSTQIERAVQRSGLNKKVSPHWFRHSAAVSFLRSEFGDSFMDRMLLTMSCLGHESAKTTSEYTRIPFAMLTKLEEALSSKYDEARYIYEKTMLLPSGENRGHIKE
jgi:site-specific recombinase XerD